MGCAPAGDKSMMDRRVWLRAIPASASTNTPRASGPRWASFAAMAWATASSACVPDRRSSSRKPAMPHMLSDPYLHPIIGDFPPGTFDRRPLWRILAQRRIGVVDVDEDLAADAERRDLLDRARAPRHVHMPHAVARLVEQALGNHLVVGVERAVEKQERRPFDPCSQHVVELGASRDIEEVMPAVGVGDFQAGGITFLRAEAGSGFLVLEIE